MRIEHKVSRYLKQGADSVMVCLEAEHDFARFEENWNAARDVVGKGAGEWVGDQPGIGEEGGVPLWT